MWSFASGFQRGGFHGANGSLKDSTKSRAQGPCVGSGFPKGPRPPTCQGCSAGLRPQPCPRNERSDAGVGGCRTVFAVLQFLPGLLTRC